MSYPAVDIRDVSFKYAGQPTSLFNHINLCVDSGERFGLFGPNGAGKTTLMSLMTGLLRGWEGDIRLLGNTIKTKSKFINTLFGYVPQDFSFYEELTAVENLAFFGAWSGLSKKEITVRTSELLGILGLTNVQHKPVCKLSGGMKRKVNLAIGVIHQPKILFLDEPTTGVDVQAGRDIINYLLLLNKNGTTLIYTSHQLNEAEGLCRQIALIDNGKIIANDLLVNLLAQHQQKGLEELFLGLTGNSYTST
ncbi:MAG: ABC transporter ATP-binding protein [Ferruginibacter sp.]